MSSGAGVFSVGVGRAGRWSAERLLASSARSRCGAGLPDFGGHAVALADDGAGFVGADRPSIGIADLIGGLGAPAGGDTGEQCGGDVAQRGVVVLAVDHEAVVFGCQGGVEAAGLVGADEQRFSQEVIAALGGAAVATGNAGGVQRGHQAAEGAYGRQRLETNDITESAQDDSSGDRADAGCRGDDAVGVAVADQHGDALVEFFDPAVSANAKRASTAMSSARSGKQMSSPH